MTNQLAGSLTALLFALSTSMAHAVMIGIGAFGAGAVTEGFEGTAIGLNNPGCNTACTGAPNGYSFPGVVSVFAFGSGLELFSPNPNPGEPPIPALGDYFAVGDFARNASVSYATNGNGRLDSSAQLPGGTAFFAASRLGLDPVAAISVEFEFPYDVVRAGAYLTGDGIGASLMMEVLDAAGLVVETANISAVNVNSWDTNFLGIENSAFRRVRFTAPGTAYPPPDSAGIAGVLIDNVIFERQTAPEPATLALLGLGIAGIGYQRRKKIQTA